MVFMRFGMYNVLLVGLNLIFLCSMEGPASQLFALRLPFYKRHGPVYQ